MVDLRWLELGTVFVLQIVFIIRALLRPHRQPASRLAWIAIIGALPLLGILAYLLLGETNPGGAVVTRIRAAMRDIPVPGKRGETMIDVEQAYNLPPRAVSLFRMGQSINGYPPMGSNRATLMADSNTAIDTIVADIDAASAHVHISFYIWLADNNGTKVAQALIRAAKRGVICRVMADDLGSRRLIHGPLWREMAAAGVNLARALPIGNALLTPLHGRFDMRNHRKIVVIDNRIMFCGSQNCADPEFRVKAKFAPWVDLLARFEGPVVLQMQHLFATDWAAETGETLTSLLADAVVPDGPGFVAQVVGTSAALRYEAMPEMFIALMGSAKDELVITTPYYVPDEALQAALRGAAHRGVRTTIVMPTRNDSWIVAAASRSYYLELLQAGVQIHEYPLGLLHTKSLTIDGQAAMIGSANMDRRSFDLNFENNVVLHDPAFTAQIRERQQTYLDASTRVTEEAVRAWPTSRALWNNTLATIGPVL